MTVQDIYLDESLVTPGADGKNIATGPLATEARQAAANAVLAKSIVQPTSETPGAELTGTAAHQRIAVPAGAYAVDLTVTVANAYLNFTATDADPDQVGRLILVNSSVRLLVPSGATKLDYIGNTAKINKAWLIR